jgi:hypothetical protein
MQKTDDYIRPRGYYDNKGNLLRVSFDTVNMALSGITASATQINTLVSGGVASAVYSSSAGYAASAGALSGLTATTSQINNILYGSTIMKYAIGSTIASNGMTLSHGLSTGLYCVVNAQTGGVIVGGHVSGSQITFFTQANIGLLFETTSAAVDFIVFGNE